MNTAVIPGEPPELLRRLQRHCRWRLEPNPGGRPTKKPDQSTCDLKACRTWDQIKAQPRSSEAGIGFVVTGGLVFKLKDGRTATLLFIDLDACCDPLTGDIAPWALDVIRACGHSFTEVSPSGPGLRGIVFVVEPPRGVRAKVDVPFPARGPGHKKPNIQLFGLGPAGYVTMTGRRLAVSSTDVLMVENLDAIVASFDLG